MKAVLLSETWPSELQCCHYHGGHSARRQVSPWRPGRRHKRRHRKPSDLWCSMVRARTEQRPQPMGPRQEAMLEARGGSGALVPT